MRPRLGTVAWLDATGGRTSIAERLKILGGGFGTLAEGIRLRRHARASGKTGLALAELAPTATPMVEAARARMQAIAGAPMLHHSMRTGYWTLLVLHQHGVVSARDAETAWVAAMLHDVGLEQPVAGGDFSAGGIAVLRELAAEHGWDDEQVHSASEAIAANLLMRVDPAHHGTLAWAMNVGGIGELGFWLHRAQMHPERIAELEAVHPRTEFQRESARLIREEVKRVPGCRFAVFRWIFPFILK